MPKYENPFTRYANEATDPAIKKRITIEGKIAKKLVEHAIKTGHTVSVYDSPESGGEWVLKRSKDLNRILSVMASTDGDLLAIRPADGSEVFGRISLIYGNGSEVISDYSASNLDKFSEWLKPVDDYANSLDR